MLNCERKFILSISAIFVGCMFLLNKEYSNYLNIYIVMLPIYLYSIRFLHRCDETRDKLDLAVSCCLEESEFNVIDKIESLRIYFNNTTDVIDYLEVVDSRLLTYVFDQKNLLLTYKDYIQGAIECLTLINNFDGSIYLNIDIINISENDKILTLLSTLYMVSKQILSGSNTIYLTSRQKDDGVFIDITDRYSSSLNNDLYCKKLLNMFSSDHFVLSAKYV